MRSYNKSVSMLVQWAAVRMQQQDRSNGRAVVQADNESMVMREQ